MPNEPAVSNAKGQTFLDGMGKILGQLGSLMAAPDADVMFVQKLQMVIAARIHQGVQQAMPVQGAPQGGQGSPPGPPGGQPGQPGGQMAGPPGVNGVNQLAQPPNPDELRRMIGAGASGAGGGQ